MNRFFRSAAFPILIVLLLAFVAQRLVVSNSGSQRTPDFPAPVVPASSACLLNGTLTTCRFSSTPISQ